MISGAGGKELRHAQHGPRLESCLHGERLPRPFPWNREASGFIPGVVANFLAREFELGFCQAVDDSGSHLQRGV
eukprot:2724344-Pyramimonas_sp.AAC.1